MGKTPEEKEKIRIDKFKKSTLKNIPKEYQENFDRVSVGGSGYHDYILNKEKYKYLYDVIGGWELNVELGKENHESWPCSSGENDVLYIINKGLINDYFGYILFKDDKFILKYNIDYEDDGFWDNYNLTSIEYIETTKYDIEKTFKTDTEALEYFCEEYSNYLNTLKK